MDFPSITTKRARDDDHCALGLSKHEDGHHAVKDFHENNSVAEERRLSRPVAIFEEGNGLPYAPIDWPNPGDIWAWRVGRRVCKAGYFLDRFLYPPWKIVPTGSPKFFACKSACQQFLKANFPDRDHVAFFDSFCWEIPAEKEDLLEDGKRELREAIEFRVSQSGRSLRSYMEETKEVGRESLEKSPLVSLDGEKEFVARETITGKEFRVSKRGRKIQSRYLKEEDCADNDDDSVSAPLKRKRCKKPNELRSDLTWENFDEYINSIEELLTQRNLVIGSSDSNSEGVSIMKQELLKSKLSSLLTVGFPSLSSSEIVKQVTSLASLILKDTSLPTNQLVKLKLVDDLPRLSEMFRETRKILEEVEIFFRRLECNKLTAISMKNAYNEIREKSKELQRRVDSGMRAEKKIGEEIEVLRSKLREIGRRIERSRAAKEELVSIERTIAGSLPLLVQLIQTSNFKVNEMEAKRSAALKQESEIIEKFDKLQKAFS